MKNFIEQNENKSNEINLVDSEKNTSNENSIPFDGTQLPSDPDSDLVVTASSTEVSEKQVLDTDDSVVPKNESNSSESENFVEDDKQTTEISNKVEENEVEHTSQVEEATDSNGTNHQRSREEDSLESIESNPLEKTQIPPSRAIEENLSGEISKAENPQSDSPDNIESVTDENQPVDNVRDESHVEDQTTQPNDVATQKKGNEEKQQISDIKNSSIEELVRLFRDTTRDSNWFKKRTLIREIRNEVTKKFDQDIEERKKTYLDSGGFAIDFSYQSKFKKDFDDLDFEHRKRKRAYFKNLESELKENTEKKLNIIEEVKKLRSANISIKKKYDQINTLQEHWRKIGQVPRSKNDELWKEYNYNLDLFYQLLDVHKTQKETAEEEQFQKLFKLLTEAEKLIDAKDILKSKTELNTLRNLLVIRVKGLSAKYRNLVWTKFKEIRKALDKNLSITFSENRKIREGVIFRLSEILENLPSNVREWQRTADEIADLEKKYNEARLISKGVRKNINKEYYNLYWNIKRHRNNFYKELSKTRKETVSAKRDIINELREILDSDDWKDRRNTVIGFRTKWQKLGFSNKKLEDKLWHEFEQLNKTYFDRIRNGYEKLSPHQESLVSAKKRFIEEFEEGFSFDSDEILKELLTQIEYWNGYGYIQPAIDYKFNNRLIAAINDKLKATDLKSKERNNLAFECILKIIEEDGKSIQGYIKETKDRIEKLEKELSQLETNFHFFNDASSSNPLVQEVEKRSEKIKENIDFAKQRFFKLKTIRTNYNKKITG